MSKSFRNLVSAIALFVTVGVVIFVVNQTAQIVQLASMVHPMLGRFVLYALLAVYAAVIVAPIWVMARLPRTMFPPGDACSPEFGAYIRHMAEHLARNPYLKGTPIALDSRQDVEAGLRILDARASAVVRETASTIFVSTAISQNGRLDALMVLVAQSRMVWRISHIYYQRPAWRELAVLYANIAATVFLVSEIEDLDLSEQMEPIVASVLGSSLAGAVPGVNIVATILTASILEGTANAFLTLRVGAICKRYCSALTAFDRRAARRSASAEAASMLGTIVLESSKTVSQTVARAARRASTETFAAAAEEVSKGMQGISQRISEIIPLRKRAGQANSDEKS